MQAKIKKLTHLINQGRALRIDFDRLDVARLHCFVQLYHDVFSTMVSVSKPGVATASYYG